MEDDNGLELTLGLPCGGSSSISKGKNGSSSDNGADEAKRGDKLIDDFKIFLDGGTQKQDSVSQRSEPLKPEEKFFDNLSDAAVNADASTNLNSREFWVANGNRSTEIEEEKRSEAGSKRKSLFLDINHQKKLERDVHHTDLHDKTRTSHISITTDEGSTAENEDVADSEADGSTSRLVSHHDDGSKRNTGGSVLPVVSNEVHGVSDSNGVESQGQTRFTISSEKEFKFGNVSYGVPFPPQSVNFMNVPYSLPKESNSISAPGTLSYSLPGMMQAMAAADSERPGNQPVMPANLPLMYGYSPVQLPMIDKDNSWGVVSRSQHLQPSYFGRGPPTSDKQNDVLKASQATVPVVQPKSPETTHIDGRTLERVKEDMKPHTVEEGSSSRTEDDAKAKSTTVRSKDTSNLPRPEGFPSEFPAIRPGIAADLKFGGCGSYPNLPWVSATGQNGRMVSGVTYKYSPTQIRIVCACHGSHMSPEEFVQHAGEEQTNPDNGSGLVSLPSSNPAASAQS